jgi:DNA-binding response OmpR family regulator
MALSGHTILVVEDEPLIALDIVEGFRAAGASVHTAHSLRDGLRLVDRLDLSAAVLDFGLGDGEGTVLCERLGDRGVPYILHTGYANVPRTCESGIVIHKPAPPQQLVGAIEKLLSI